MPNGREEMSSVRLTTFSDGLAACEPVPPAPARRWTVGELTNGEHEMLHTFRHSLDEYDWSYVRASHVIDGPVTTAHRATIKSLRVKGLLELIRGGQDDEGRVIGGTFYGITEAGRQALRPTPSSNGGDDA
jgi:hypothetical protein